jgi:hypothetical protein
LARVQANWTRTTARAKQLEAEERALGNDPLAADEPADIFSDDPDDDQATPLGDDEIDLFQGGNLPEYSDDFTDTENDDDPFDRDDSDEEEAIGLHSSKPKARK